MTDEPAKPKFSNLSEAELAGVQRRFRERRRKRLGRGQVAAASQHYRRIAIWAFAVIVLLAIVGTVLSPSPAAPKPRSRVRIPPADPPEAAAALGDSAHVPPGCREVEGAVWASLAALADGSSAARDAQRRLVAERQLPLEIENSVGMRFRLVPVGVFTMGSPASEPGRGPDEQAHEVRVASFYLGKYEVTQSQWNAVMGAKTNPSHVRQDGANRPVDEVSWQKCQQFIERLCQLEGLPPGAYRLPHEEEWEYACRAGAASAYHFGNDQRLLRFFADYRGNNGKRAAQVGQRRANAFGLYDMHGNVWEWCQNEFYYYDTFRVDRERRALRGGNWHLPASDCRAASRYRYPPDSQSNLLGFRVLRVLLPPVAIP